MVAKPSHRNDRPASKFHSFPRHKALCATRMIGILSWESVLRSGRADNLAHIHNIELSSSAMAGIESDEVAIETPARVKVATNLATKPGRLQENTELNQVIALRVEQ